MNRDFTLATYRKLLLTLQQSGYSFFTFEDWCEGKASGRYVILRHDVDTKSDHSLVTAQIESEMGIRATYYFRVVPQSNKPHIITAIAGLGHEIGYHYEDLSLFKGVQKSALEHFKQQLTYFRQFYPVCTICMHGSPTSKWDNRDLWKTNNYRDYGIIGEPYFDFLNPIFSTNDLKNKVMYITDTARMWGGDKFNVRDKVIDQLSVNSNQLSVNNNNSTIQQSTIHSTFDFIDWLQTNPVQNVIMITTHPQRWTNKPVEWLLELVLQNAKNRIKRLIVRKG